MTAVVFERQGDVARIRLNRPEAMNAFDQALADALADAAAVVAADEAVRVVVLSGEGRMFSAGGDLRYLGDPEGDGPKRVASVVGALHRALIDLAQSPALVLAAVHGHAAGAGLSLVAGADYAIAAEGVKFTSAYTGAGLSPDGGLSWHLPRVVGLRRARRMILANTPVSATEALEIGLVDEVVPAGDFEAAVEARAQALAAGPGGAQGRVKALLAGDLAAYERHLERERQGIMAQFAHAEGREGLAAFAEKRKPDFRAI